MQFGLCRKFICIYGYCLPIKIFKPGMLLQGLCHGEYLQSWLLHLAVDDAVVGLEECTRTIRFFQINSRMQDLVPIFLSERFQPQGLGRIACGELI